MPAPGTPINWAVEWKGTEGIAADATNQGDPQQAEMNSELHWRENMVPGAALESLQRNCGNS